MQWPHFLLLIKSSWFNGGSCKDLSFLLRTAARCVLLFCGGGGWQKKSIDPEFKKNLGSGLMISFSINLSSQALGSSSLPLRYDNSFCTPSVGYQWSCIFYSQWYLFRRWQKCLLKSSRSNLPVKSLGLPVNDVISDMPLLLKINEALTFLSRLALAFVWHIKPELLHEFMIWTFGFFLSAHLKNNVVSFKNGSSWMWRQGYWFKSAANGIKPSINQMQCRYMSTRFNLLQLFFLYVPLPWFSDGFASDRAAPFRHDTRTNS